MGISIWQLLIVLVIIMLLFGTKKLRNLGGDLGSSIKNFRSAMKENENAANAAEENKSATNDATAKVEHSGGGKVIEGEAHPVDEKKATKV